MAVDLKADAVDATRRNAALNGMDGRVEATIAPLGEIEGTFDVVVANVGRAAVVELAPELVRLVAPGGWLAVSGISSSQCALVVGFLGPLVELSRRTSDEWAAVVLAPREDMRFQRSRDGEMYANGPAQTSAVVGSITVATRATTSAGNPPHRACSRMMSASVAL